MSVHEGIAVAILAGGLGTRLRPAVADRPKVLAEVAGRPFVVQLLDQLSALPVRSVLLLTGRGARQIRLTLGDNYAGLPLSYSEEPFPLDTGGAIRWGLPALQAPTILLLNGDSYCDVDLQHFILWHRQNKAAASLVLAWLEDASRYGRVSLNDEDRALGFHEKSASTPGWINAGIYLFQRRLLQILPAGVPLSLERDLLPGWVSQSRVFGYCCPGRFLDIGTPESYASAEEFFAAGRTTTHAE